VAEVKAISKAAERRYQVHALHRWVVRDGYGPKQLMDAAIKGWKCSPRVASGLVAEALELSVTAISHYDRIRMASVQVERMEALLQRSLQQGELQVALGVNRELNALIFKVAEFEAAQEEAAAAIAPSLTEEEQEAADRAGDF